MAVQDLRDWIALMESAGELRKVQGADSDIELGVIVDQFQRRMELPAVLFDEIKGYPKGFRVLANTLTSTRRIALTLRLPAESSKMELVQAWRKYAKQYPKIAPRWVSDGPVNENIRRGKVVGLRSGLPRSGVGGTRSDVVCCSGPGDPLWRERARGRRRAERRSSPGDRE